MDCESVRNAIAEAWGSGAAPSARVRRHLGRCGACVSEARLIGAILNGAAGAPALDPGAGYWDSFLPRLRERLERERAAGETRPVRLGGAWRWVRPSWLLPAAAAAMLLLAAALALRPGPPAVAPRASTDLADLQARVESEMTAAATEASLAIAGLVPTRDAAFEATLDADAALEALDDVSAILSGGAAGGWPDLAIMVEGLSDEEMAALISGLDAPDRSRLGDAPKEEA